MVMLSRTEELLLLAVWRLQSDAYGAGIRDYLVDRTDEDFSIGVVYSTLDRLARKGLLRASLGEPTPERGGRAKRYFHLTEKGVGALNHTRGVSEGLWSGLPDLDLPDLDLPDLDLPTGT